FSDDHGADVTHEGVRRGRTNTTAHTRAADQQCVNPCDTEKNLEIGAEESARPPLVDHAVARLRLEVVDDLGAPAALNLHPTHSMVFHLQSPEARTCPVSGNEPLGVDDWHVACSCGGRKSPDRIISRANGRI